MKFYLNQLASFIYRYRIHFIAWFLFIFYEVIISGLLRGYFASFGNYALFYFFNIGLFYIHSHVVMPVARRNTNYTIWLLPLLIVIEVAIYVPLTIYITFLFEKYGNLKVLAPVVFSKSSVGNGVWRTMYFVLFSTGYYYLVNYLRERKITQEAEKERLFMIIENQSVQAELIKSQHAHLKAQINPHFLFNTLSFIYSNARKTAPEAAEAIMALSEMMRYAIKEDGDETFTDIMLEIEQVENLIKLYQLKSSDQLHVIFDYDSHLSGIQVIPLVLITLIENMFKHGDLSQAEHPARINIHLIQDTLVIETENLINFKGTHVSHHIGLDNIKKRLGMVYDNKAILTTNKMQNQHFNVRLTIEYPD